MHTSLAYWRLDADRWKLIRTAKPQSTQRRGRASSDHWPLVADNLNTFALFAAWRFNPPGWRLAAGGWRLAA
ncbi:MAG: hypothetical protein J7D61_16120, partial [Marichromatium sp.]|nr:hypothetical protein [Marichromatium sp.]